MQPPGFEFLIRLNAEVGEIVDNGLPVRIVARFPEDLRAEGRDLEALPVTTPAGDPVRLGDAARVGPYAHLPAGSAVASGAVTGAFYTAGAD